MLGQNKKHVLAGEVNEILSRKGYSGVCHPLINFADTIEKNAHFANNKVVVYKWLAFVLLLLIPLLSTYVSVVVNMKDDDLFKDSLPYTTGLLTIMTVVNSIYRPRTRFTKSCILGMTIDSLVQKIPAPQRSRKLVGFTDKAGRRQRVEENGRNLYYDQVHEGSTPECTTLYLFNDRQRVTGALRR